MQEYLVINLDKHEVNYRNKSKNSCEKFVNCLKNKDRYIIVTDYDFKISLIDLNKLCKNYECSYCPLCINGTCKFNLFDDIEKCLKRIDKNG